MEDVYFNRLRKKVFSAKKFSNNEVNCRGDQKGLLDYYLWTLNWYFELNYHDQKIRWTLTHAISYIRTLSRGHGHLQGHVFPRGLETRILVIIMTSKKFFFFLILLERRGPECDRILCKEYRCNLQDTFRLIYCTFAMTS